MPRYLQRLKVRLSIKLAISSIVVTVLLVIISVALGYSLASANATINNFGRINVAIAASTRLSFALDQTINASQQLQSKDNPTAGDRVNYYAARKPLLEAQQQLAALYGASANPQWDELNTRLAALVVNLDHIADLAPTDVNRARDLWNTTAFDLANETKARASAFNTAIVDNANATRTNTQQQLLFATIILIGLVIVAVIVSILFGVLNNAVFVHPLRSIEYELERIADGDLTHQLKVDNRDELGDLVTTFNRTVSELRGLITELKHQTTDIEGASVQVSDISRQQLDSSQAQVQSLSAATQLIAELKSAAFDIDQSASAVATAASQALSSAAAGRQSISANLQSMQQIEGRVYDINTQVHTLSEGLAQVGRILELMNELADDSKMLSLNATIEAVGAGAQNRRFVAVAAELTRLSQRSKEATDEVRIIIESIFEAMTRSLHAAEEGLHEVARGTELSRKSELATNQIVNAVSNTANLANNILASTHQQRTASSQVATTIQSVNQVASTNLTASDIAASTASRLTLIASQLRDAAGNFEVNLGGHG